MAVEHDYPADPTIIGELCDLHRCTCGKTVKKVAREDDADMALLNEQFALIKVRSDEDHRVLPFVPEPLAQPGDTLVLNWLDGWYTLEQVKERHGDLDPRDMAWMFRRLLVVLGFAARAKLVHGAVVPSNVMIHPEQHGLTLIDWCYAKPAENPLAITSEKYEEWYPVEVRDDLPVYPATDIDMAARNMIWLVGGDPVTATVPDGVPREYKAFFAPLNAWDVLGRYDDAWKTKALFEELITRLYGPRKFRPFSMAD